MSPAGPWDLPHTAGHRCVEWGWRAPDHRRFHIVCCCTYAAIGRDSRGGPVPDLDVLEAAWARHVEDARRRSR